MCKKILEENMMALGTALVNNKAKLVVYSLSDHDPNDRKHCIVVGENNLERLSVTPFALISDPFSLETKNQILNAINCLKIILDKPRNKSNQQSF